MQGPHALARTMPALEYIVSQLVYQGYPISHTFLHPHRCLRKMNKKKEREKREEFEKKREEKEEKEES